MDCVSSWIFKFSHTLSCHTHNIELSKSVNILGVTLSNNLKWDIHFDKALLSANRRLHVLRLLIKSYVSKNDLLEFLRASIIAIIMYASPLFGPLSSNINGRIKKLKKRAHRIICNASCTCAIIPDLTAQRERLALNLLLKCELSTHPLHSLLPSRMPNTKKFCIPFCSTNRRLNSFFPYTCVIANK